jgi:hypothetical protein
MKYILRAYKPDSDDHCMGCHMASYRSDYIVRSNLSEEQLIEEIAKIKTKKLGHNEWEYEIEYSYMPTDDIPYEKELEIDEKSDILVENILAERKAKEIEENLRKAEEAFEKQKQQELNRSKELKEKYESKMGDD